MRRDTLMKQVFRQSATDNYDTVLEISLTMTTPTNMRELAREHGLICSSYRQEHHMVKFVPFIDTDGEEDAEMIEHDFYF